MTPTLCLFLLRPVLLSGGESRKEKRGEKKTDTDLMKKKCLSDIAGEEIKVQRNMLEEMSELEKIHDDRLAFLLTLWFSPCPLGMIENVKQKEQRSEHWLMQGQTTSSSELTVATTDGKQCQKCLLSCCC